MKMLRLSGLALVAFACLSSTDLQAQTTYCPPSPNAPPGDCQDHYNDPKQFGGGPPETGYPGEPLGSTVLGDPVSIVYGSAHLDRTDLVLRTSRGPLTFLRRYNSNDESWAYPDKGGSRPLEYVPTPFGASLTDTNSLRWWHSFYSFVVPYGSQSGVRDIHGRWLDFASNCTGIPCLNTAHTINEADRNFIEPIDGGGFILHDDANRKLYYTVLWQPNLPPYELEPAEVFDRYFLSRIEDDRGRVLAQLTYAQPTGDCPMAPTGKQANGAPYVSQITTDDGALVSLKYTAMSSNHPNRPYPCVLHQIKVTDRGNADGAPAAGAVLAIQYSYANGTAGALNGVSYHGDSGQVLWSESYSDTATTVQASRAGTPVETYTFDGSNRVTTAKWPGNDWSFSYLSGSAYCPSATPDDWRCTSQFETRRVRYLHAGKGDGSANSPSFERDFRVIGNDNVIHGPRMLQHADGCAASPSSCSESPRRVEAAGEYDWGKVSRWVWEPRIEGTTDAEDMVGYERAHKNSRGFWTVYEESQAPTGQPIQFTERNAVNVGQTGMYSEDRLFRQEYDYTYSARGQELQYVWETSSLHPSEKSETKYVRNTFGRIEAILHSGWTKTYDSEANSWSTLPISTPRTIGTFFSSTRSCSGSSEEPDPDDRVVEVRGPCIVNAGGTDCDAGQQFPVIQYWYHPDTESSNRAGKLSTIRRYTQTNTALASTTGACAGQAYLQTQIGKYNRFGNPSEIVDANGVTTTLAYEGTLLESITVGGRTTTLHYDQKKLTAVQHPHGGFTVYCHREGNGDACVTNDDTSAPWSPELQWVARAADKAGTGWSERIDYTYWDDGTIRSVALRTPSGTRATYHFAADAQRRPTWAGAGTQPEKHAVALYDSRHNLTGVGHAFNDPASPSAWNFCGGRKLGTDAYPDSVLCTALSYDRADRLASADFPAPGAFPQGLPFPEPSTEGSATQSCFTYDTHSNVKSVCTVASTESCASCPAESLSEYVYDDFGNLVEVRHPWYELSGGSNSELREYNALGQVVRTQTPAMRSPTGFEYLTYTHDAAGRLRTTVRRWKEGTKTGSETLFALSYDGESPPATACGTLAQGKGRLTRVDDSFGTTWFRYDSFGRLTQEIRQRAGTTCSAGIANSMPHTTYGYVDGVPGTDTTSATPSEVTITYPHGREVTYAYGTGANAFRIASVSISANGAWTDEKLVTDIQWEPFGGVRSYRAHFPDSANTATVEYVLMTDGSGRISHTRVSKIIAGDLFNQEYAWRADQLVTQSTSVAGGDAQVEEFDYDRMLRLRTATRAGYGATTTGGGFDETGGAYRNRAYGYDARGHRQSETVDGLAWTLARTGDRLASRMRTDGTGTGARTYLHDADGRVIAKRGSGHTEGVPNFEWSFGYGGTALNQVFRTVEYNGAFYHYYYDAFGRRRAKAYPTEQRDEYFYAGSSLIEDQGFGGIPTNHYVVDEYVWLGGRPIAKIRSKFDLAWQRQSDLSVDCSRIDTFEKCGLYFVVTDYLRKPVLMLDAARRITGTGEYDPFGHVNRVTEQVSFGGGEWRPFTSAQAKRGLELELRPRFDVLLARPGACWMCESEESCWSYGALNSSTVDVGDSTGTVLFTASDVASRSVQTSWLNPSGVLSLRGFAGIVPQTCSGTCDANASSMTGVPLASSIQCRGGATERPCDAGNLAGQIQVVLDSYEYRRFQTGASPMWTPMRFPGHYYDPETDLFENWNRFYDPQLGSYLQAEPLWQYSPRHVQDVARAGFSLSAYSYAASNPILYVDRNGLYVGEMDPAMRHYWNAIKAEGEFGEFLTGRIEQSPVRVDFRWGKPIGSDGRRKAGTTRWRNGGIEVTIDPTWALEPSECVSRDDGRDLISTSVLEVIVHEVYHAGDGAENPSALWGPVPESRTSLEMAAQSAAEAFGEVTGWYFNLLPGGP